MRCFACKKDGLIKTTTTYFEIVPLSVTSAILAVALVPTLS